MSNRSAATISIGGPLKSELLEPLAIVIADTGAALYWGGNSFAPATAEALLDAADEKLSLLCLFDEQAPDGAFADLERFLEANGIGFDRRSEAACECGGEVVRYRPDLGIVVHRATQEGEALILRCDILRVRDQLRAAINQRSPELVRNSLADLEHAIGDDLPALGPFRIEAP